MKSTVAVYAPRRLTGEALNLLAFEPFPTRPPFADLLQKSIPLGFVSVASWRGRSEIAEGIIWSSPSFKVPGSRLPVRPTDLCAILFNERTDSRMAIHCLEHIQADAVQPDERQVVIERGKPPFVRVMVIGDEVGNVPGKKAQGLSSQAPGSMDSGRGFHGEQLAAMGGAEFQQPTGAITDRARC